MGIPIYAPYLFQSTLPREERRGCIMSNYEYLGFQSTLPREERQSPVGAMFVGNNISIHAPTRGATLTARNTKQKLTS